MTNKIYVTNSESDNVTVIDGATNVTQTVGAGDDPTAVAANPVTNKVYVANRAGDNVTVIDGATNATQTVGAGAYPYGVAVNPVTNKVYVANYESNTVTVIDGATNDTQAVAVGTNPRAVVVNPVTNKIYVTNSGSGTVTVIDGATNDTLTVAAGDAPWAAAVNPVTNKVYVTNYSSDNVTVIDGATNATLTVAAGDLSVAAAVNPVTNKIYVTNSGSANVTVIDGATNATQTVGAGAYPYAVAVNPVTDKVYVTNRNSDNVTVLDVDREWSTGVEAQIDPLPGHVVYAAQPAITGRGVNRWTPSRTTMMGVLQHCGSSQLSWDWTALTSGQGTDSVHWAWDWGTDELLWGENFLCLAPLEDQAGITNNLGLGSPFAGNLLVYPVYRVLDTAAIVDGPGQRWVSRLLSAQPNPFSNSALVQWSLAHDGNVSLQVYDASGRVVRTLATGRRSAGNYTTTWDGRDDSGRRASRGVYCCRFSAGDFIGVTKLVLQH